MDSSVLGGHPCWMCLSLYLALVDLGLSDCSAMALAKIHHSELGEVAPMWAAEYLREVFLQA